MEVRIPHTHGCADFTEAPWALTGCVSCKPGSFCFFETVSLQSLGWPWTHNAPPASTTPGCELISSASVFAAGCESIRTGRWPLLASHCRLSKRNHWTDGSALLFLRRQKGPDEKRGQGIQAHSVELVSYIFIHFPSEKGGLTQNQQSRQVCMSKCVWASVSVCVHLWSQEPNPGPSQWATSAAFFFF